MSDRITISTSGGVADVRLNRPEKLNALDGAMFQALAEAGSSLAQDRQLRAVVLSGEGRGFSATASRLRISSTGLRGRLEADLQRGLIGSPNQVETVRSELEKREPSYVESE